MKTSGHVKRWLRDKTSLQSGIRVKSLIFIIRSSTCKEKPTNDSAPPSMCSEIKTVNKQHVYRQFLAHQSATQTSLAARSFHAPRKILVRDESHFSLVQETHDLTTFLSIRSGYRNKHRTGTLQGLLYSCI